MMHKIILPQLTGLAQTLVMAYQTILQLYTPSQWNTRWKQWNDCT